jgi:hypothetical protein
MLLRANSRLRLDSVGPLGQGSTPADFEQFHLLIGHVMVNANPYAYPVVTGTAIFLAALLDSLRLIAPAGRRRISGPQSSDPSGDPEASRTLVDPNSL